MTLSLSVRLLFRLILAGVLLLPGIPHSIIFGLVLLETVLFILIKIRLYV